MAILVLTRPTEASRRFSLEVQKKMGLDISVIISPLLEIVQLPAKIESRNKALVLTSANAVSGAVRLGFRSGTKAFCVGAKTAEAAQEAGFQTLSADGNADDLVSLIADLNPATPLVHVRGEHTRGNVANRLSNLGFPCESVTTYRQAIRPPTETLLSALLGDEPLLVPLFSPRSALIFGLVEEIRAPLHIIAISQAVASEVADLGVDTVRVIDKPDAQSMVAATCHRLFELLGPSIA